MNIPVQEDWPEGQHVFLIWFWAAVGVKSNNTSVITNKTSKTIPVCSMITVNFIFCRPGFLVSLCMAGSTESPTPFGSQEPCMDADPFCILDIQLENPSDS